ncbi:uracil-xanthine permease family protein [Alteromonas sp. Mac1]|uniref:uracil-xanthine permease family protein n=1 Tax=Alteromonas sp. Mac1 TaxID=1777491 RepID=UPI000770059C|nr:nucleobase:cation symporter-2 family protein [Alteromonas sp. Mac1]AMJ86474.1 xanthine permease XanP [Alteromonas sp. Mac1]AMJ90333.1 xanthine permease XanP [Alteromonas sp. Mac2]
MQEKHQDLLYSLHDKPNAVACLTAAFQHMLASFIGVITPTLIISATLGLTEHTAYLICMALFVSGVGTFIQTKKIGPVGSGLVAIQGTSFAFISALLLAGMKVKNEGGSSEDILSLLFGLTLAGALVEVVFSLFVTQLKRIITPLTTGIVITAIGLSLINVGMTDLAGGFNAESFASLDNLGLGVSVLLIIVFLNASNNHWVRLSAIFVGMTLGTAYVWITKGLDFSHLTALPAIAVPQPFKFGISFDITLFLPIALIYLFTAIETAGDLTANSLFCKEPVSGPVYLSRIKGGILGDGLNSMIAGAFNTFPNTTFGQNNGVIQLTGIASRKVGFFVAGMFVFVGLFPVVGGVLQAIPKPVLGGATLVMFAMVAVGGLKLLASYALDRRSSLITACALGMSIGVMMVPSALSQLPTWLENVLLSPVTSAGLTAIILDLTLPQAPHKASDNTSEPASKTQGEV